MTDRSCIFCTIINRETPSQIVRETDTLFVIKDLYPKAPVHYLIIPKVHRDNILAFTDQDGDLASSVCMMARDLGNELEGTKAFNLISNNGREAGQSVMHVHWHFLAGKNIYTSAFCL